MTYLIRGRFERGRLASSVVHILPDDCLKELSIDGKPVDLAKLTDDQLCNWRGGVTLDLAPYLPAGESRNFTLTLFNRGGPYGLSLEPRPGAVAISLTLLRILLFALTFWCLLRTVRLSWLPALLLASAAELRYEIIFDLHRAEEHAFSDAGNYLQHGLSIAAGHFWIGQTFQGIGYPVLLAAAFKLGGSDRYLVAYLMQFAASLLTVLLGWRATARLLGEKRGLWALAILAFHVPFLTLSGFFMAETSFGLGVTTLFYLLARYPFPWRWPTGFAMGVIHMASAAVKGLNSFFAPLLLVWGLGHAWRLGLFTGARRDLRLAWRRLVGPLVAFALGSAAFAIPQGWLTAKLYGSFMLSAPTGALNLVEGKCPEKLNRDSTGAYWLSPLFAQLGETKEKRWPRPFTDQGYFWRAGLDCIRANPRVLLTSFRYDYFLFSGNELWPPNMTRFSGLSHRYAILFALLFVPGILIGLGRAFRQPFATRALPYLPALSILLCAWALKSEMRYRVPFDCYFIALGIAGWSWLFERTGIARRLPAWAPDAAFGVGVIGLAIAVGLPIVFAR